MSFFSVLYPNISFSSYLANHNQTKEHTLEITISSPSRFWGSYRPGVYFGLKTRSLPADLLAGLMWMLPGKVAPSNLGLRHWCDQNDGLSRYSDI